MEMKNIFDIFILLNFCLSQPTFGLYCTKLISGKNITFCCNNSEKTDDGQCRECATGFISIDGEPCKQCLGGWYGPKCIDRCLCGETEWCSHIDGSCTAYSTVQDSSMFPDMKEFSFSTNAGSNKEASGLQKKEIIIYCTSIGGFVFLFILVTSIACCFKDNIYRVENRTVRDIQSQENFYDSIDESDMQESSHQGFVDEKQHSSDDSVRHIILEYESPTGSHTLCGGKDTITTSTLSFESPEDVECCCYLHSYQTAQQIYNESHGYEQFSVVQYIELLDISTLPKSDELHTTESNITDEDLNKAARKEAFTNSTNKRSISRQYRSEFDVNNAKQNFENHSKCFSSSY